MNAALLHGHLINLRAYDCLTFSIPQESNYKQIKSE